MINCRTVVALFTKVCSSAVGGIVIYCIKNILTLLFLMTFVDSRLFAIDSRLFAVALNFLLPTLDFLLSTLDFYSRLLLSTLDFYSRPILSTLDF